LRAKTVAFKEKIKQARAEKDAKIAALKLEAESIKILIKEKIFTLEIDALEKEAYEISEKTLKRNSSRSLCSNQRNGKTF
jgi:preprotein translocase subunit SecA